MEKTSPVLSGQSGRVFAGGIRQASMLVAVLAVLTWFWGTPPVAIAQPEDAWVNAGLPDPTAVVHEGQVYLFATGRGIRIARSDNLYHWKSLGRVFESSVPAWAAQEVPNTRGVWAPDISFHNGLYYLYYSISTLGSQRSVIGLAVNRTLDPADPNYAWEDRGPVIDSAPDRTDFNAIDPALVVDEQGDWWLMFGSWWKGIKAIQIDPETGKPHAGDREVVAIAGRAAAERPSIEAAYVVRHEGFYYLFVSWGTIMPADSATYRVMVGRSKNVIGPYTDFRGRPMREGAGTLVLSSHEPWQGPGHNGFLRWQDKDWMVHHTYDLRNPRAGRILQVRPVYWIDGWPVVGEPLARPWTAGESRALEAQDVAGPWQHGVDYADEHEIQLSADGQIPDADGTGSWSVEGRMLHLNWKSDQAPGGAWRDRVIVEPDGRSYIGRNQNGQIIRGTRGERKSAVTE